MENIENNTETATIETLSPKAKKEKGAPAYLAFIAALENKAQALGLSVKEQKGYFQFKNLATGHRMVVAKQGKAVTRIDTTLEVLGQEGTYALDVPNGRIACHIEAVPETVAFYLEMLASGDEKLRAPKREKKAKPEVATEQPAA
jgi:hypothetical protein